MFVNVMKIRQFIPLFLCSLGALPWRVTGAEWLSNNYLLLAPQYADVKVGSQSEQGVGVALTFGTQIDPKWYMEIGYNVMADGLTLPQDGSALSANEQTGVDAHGAHLSLLGKARGETGELFYKIGVMQMGYEMANEVALESDCVAGSIRTVNGQDRTASYCVNDENVLAGVVGLGFDFFVGFSSQLRLSYEHIRGQDSFEANVVQLGIRYNF